MHGAVYMIVAMALISYFVMSNVMLTGRHGVYQHLNKLYMALLMGALMGAIHYAGGPTEYLGAWLLVSVLLILLIRRQELVTDREFLKGMIEHHDMALLMAERVRGRTRDQRIQRLANQIIEAQEQEIELMKGWLGR